MQRALVSTAPLSRPAGVARRAARAAASPTAVSWSELTEGGAWPHMSQRSPLVACAATGLQCAALHCAPAVPQALITAPSLQLLNLFNRPKPAAKKAVRETVVPKPSYNIPAVLLGELAGAVVAPLRRSLVLLTCLPWPLRLVHCGWRQRSPAGRPRPTGCSCALTLPRAGTAGLSHFAGSDAVAAVTGILGAFLAVQASRVRFVFDDEALEVRWEMATQMALVLSGLCRGRRPPLGSGRVICK